MNKDPAFLFYASDFLTGVADLTFEERGQYITLLCIQHQKGHFPEKTCRIVLSIDSVNDIKDVIKKFVQDENGDYYNKRLESEIQKRSKSAEASRKNGEKGGRPKKTKNNPNHNQEETDRLLIGYPKSNLSENENENIIINKDIDNIINNYTTNEALKIELFEHIKMKKIKKAAVTVHATKLCLSKLDKLSCNDSEKIKIVQNSIMSAWTSFFPLRDSDRTGTIIKPGPLNNFSQENPDFVQIMDNLNKRQQGGGEDG